MTLLKSFSFLRHALFTKHQINSVQIAHRFLSTIAEPAQQPPRLDKLYKKIEIEVRGNDPAVLTSYGIFSTEAAKHLGITVGRNSAPKKHQFERWTVLKSAFVHKKHRVQYEMRTYYRYLDFFRLTESTADTFLEYIQRNLPEGVAMKVTKVRINKARLNIH
uniref:Small ribosomal subunit protein uS10m n=1 Tax=Fopius arisanus TaxID=64838 RepID=A0A0C9QWF7_9HYME